MDYLIDTNVISEWRKGRRCDPAVSRWQRRVDPHQLFVSCLTLMEIKAGYLGARKRDVNFATVLESWYRDQLKPAFEGRVLPVDLEICEHASALLSHRTREAADCLIAATALVHRFTLVTRNIADFADTGIRLVNPWQV